VTGRSIKFSLPLKIHISPSTRMFTGEEKRSSHSRRSTSEGKCARETYQMRKLHDILGGSLELKEVCFQTRMSVFKKRTSRERVYNGREGIRVIGEPGILSKKQQFPRAALSHRVSGAGRRGIGGRKSSKFPREDTLSNLGSNRSVDKSSLLSGGREGGRHPCSRTH